MLVPHDETTTLLGTALLWEPGRTQAKGRLNPRKQGQAWTSNFLWFGMMLNKTQQEPWELKTHSDSMGAGCVCVCGGGAKPTLLNLFPLTLCSQDFEMLRFYLPILSLISRRPTMSHVVGSVLEGCKRRLKCNFPEIWPPCVKTASSEWRTACIAVLKSCPANLQRDILRRWSLGGDWAMKGKPLYLEVCPHERGHKELPFPLAV